MLQTLRVHAGSWFIKVLFAVLVLSFALWGVGDVLRNYNSMRPVISVGGFSVSLDEFMHTLRDMTSRAQTTAKGKLSPEDLQNLKFEEKIIEEFVDKGLIYEEIEAHKIVVPDETLTAHLHVIPAFQNEKGRFDPRAFRGALSRTHMSESGFIAHLRQILKQRQLMMPYTISTYLPQAYRDILFQGITQAGG